MMPLGQVYEFTGAEWFHIKDRGDVAAVNWTGPAFSKSVLNPKDVFPEVIIDGVRYKVKGVESFAVDHFKGAAFLIEGDRLRRKLAMAMLKGSCPLPFDIFAKAVSDSFVGSGLSIRDLLPKPPKFRRSREVHAHRARKLRRRGEYVHFVRWEHGHCIYSWGGPTPETFTFRMPMRTVSARGDQ
jgi:hypothetical protein